MINAQSAVTYSTITLSKSNGQTFMFIYQPGQAAKMIWQVMKFAMDRELDFSWKDAAEVTKMIRHLATRD